MSQAILLFSHGSVLCGAGENLSRIARRLENEGAAPIVEVGYLNYSEPAFETAFAKCVSRGATSITIMPYFLIAGKFVQVDLPPKIEAMRARFPQVRVLAAQAMTDHDALADALLACARRDKAPAAWRDILNVAPQFCRDNAQCPLHGSEKCPATRGNFTPQQL